MSAQFPRGGGANPFSAIRLLTLLLPRNVHKVFMNFLGRYLLLSEILFGFLISYFYILLFLHICIDLEGGNWGPVPEISQSYRVL